MGLKTPGSSTTRFSLSRVHRPKAFYPRVLSLFTTVMTAAFAAGVAAGTAALPASAAAANQYKATVPTRILDTRPAPFGPIGSCTPSPCAQLGPGGSLNVVVSAPSTPAPGNAAAVVLNVTAVPQAGDPPRFLTVYPTPASGNARPNISNINYSGSLIVQNLATVPVGANNQVTIYNNAGSVNVLFDE